MKKNLLTALTCSMALIVPAVLAEKSNIEAYTWFRYTAEIKKAEIEKSMFGIKRGYFRWNHYFTDKIESRVNVDIFSSDKEEYPDGAGLKLKYAYLNFKDIVKDGNLTIGLKKCYFGLIYDWKYPTIQKCLESKEKVIASADYGISFNGDLPNGYGEYALGIANGEGYKKYGTNVNKNPAFLANLRVIPIPGITIGGSFLYEQSGLLDEKKTEYDQRLLYAGMSRIAFGFLDIWLEYLMADRGPKDNITKSAGFMVMPILSLKKLVGVDVDLVARVDRWDKNTEKPEDAHTRVITGFNWHLLRREKGKIGVVLQVNWERTSYEDPEKDLKDAVMAQLRWEFAAKPF